MEESRVVLGKRIRKLRRKAGLTQGELAEKAKVSPKHLGEIEPVGVIPIYRTSRALLMLWILHSQRFLTTSTKNYPSMR